MDHFLTNDWFISIASSLIMLAVVPIGTATISAIRALFGVYSGTYIAITTRGKEQIIELVKCKHIGNKVKGKIEGVAFILNESSERNFETNTNKFSFKGSVAERRLVISYNSIIKGNASAGSLTLYGNTVGNDFSGICGGFEADRVVSYHCKWLKASRALNLKKDCDTIMDLVKMDSINFILVDNSSGKSLGNRTFILRDINQEDS